MKPTGRITKNAKVSDAEKLLTVPATVVKEDQIIEEIAKKIAESPACKTIAVVDAVGKLIGVIPVSQVIDDVFLQVMPAAFLANVVDFDSAVSFDRNAMATKAGDLMQAPVWVEMEDTVKDAFELMHKTQLNGLPIVDDSNHVIGYLDMLELLLVWIKAKGE